MLLRWHSASFYLNKCTIYDNLGSTKFFGFRIAENGDLVCTGELDEEKGEWNNSAYSWPLRLDSMGCYTP